MNKNAFTLIGVLSLAFSFSACNSSDQPNPPVAGTDTVLQNQAVSSNGPIDFIVPLSLEPQTDAEVFDESVIFSPNFGINQNDPELRDLFSPQGVSNLCFPTSLAEDLIYLYGYHQPQMNQLALSGISAGPSGKSIDPNTLIRQLASLCHTDPSKGTDSLAAIQCVSSLLTQSGYSLAHTQMISPFNQPDPNLPIVSREVTIDDFRNALKQGTPILMEVGWYKYDPTTQSWSRHDGHYVSVHGYDYDLSWGQNQIQLKIINPETRYEGTRKDSLWDTVILEKVSPQPGITYPANRPYVVSGSGFGGLTDRGFVGLIITIAP